MRKTLLALSALILLAGPAQARFAVWQDDLTPNQSKADYATFSARYEAIGPISLCGYSFNYDQLISIPGGPAVHALTEATYPAGREPIRDLGESCDGFSIYVATVCEC